VAAGAAEAEAVVETGAAGVTVAAGVIGAVGAVDPGRTVVFKAVAAPSAVGIVARRAASARAIAPVGWETLRSSVPLAHRDLPERWSDRARGPMAFAPMRVAPVPVVRWLIAL